MALQDNSPGSAASSDLDEYSDCVDNIEEQLGTLPPRTLVLAMYPEFPYFPAYVLSRHDAQNQGTLVTEVAGLEDGTTIGCCVRFFRTNTCAVLPATSIEPLVLNDKTYMQWIWRSSVAQQKVMGWREFPPYVFHMWEEAFVEASTFASHSSRIIPEIAFEKQSLVKTGRGHRKVGFLKPGTIVWTSMETHPIWPAYVQKGKGRPKVSKGALTSTTDDATEPLSFIGDDMEDRAPLYTSTDSMMAFTTDKCWLEHIRARSLLSMKERGLRKTTKSDWELWEKACAETFAVAGVTDQP